jgi:glycosyltransferase involved in cell wall biosynthesis
VYFLIIGEIGDKAYGESLKGCIADNGLSGSAKLLGFIDDQALINLLHNADVCVNLRYPSTESASASLVEQMHFGKPVIVNEIGFYNEVPDDCVVKVKLEREKEDLQDALTTLVDSPQERLRIGKNAANWVRQNHAPEQYATAFLELVREVKASRYRVDFMDKVTEELKNISMNEDFVSKVSVEIASMLPSSSIVD